MSPAELYQETCTFWAAVTMDGPVEYIVDKEDEKIYWFIGWLDSWDNGFDKDGKKK